MNDISTAVQRSPANNRHDKESKIIPSNTKYDGITHAKQDKSETIQKNSWRSEHHTFIGVCTFILFTIISMPIGIIVVCVTSPKETDTTCRMTFKRTAQRTITYDSRPRHIATGDFNGDNYPDLVIANSGIDKIGIRLSDNNGNIVDEIMYSTGFGSRPLWVAVNDFNNDTFLDIVVANYGTNNIGVFLGHGNGSFAHQLIFPLNSSRPLSLAIGDFNNDNKLDIVVANNGTLNVTILIGLENGSFRIESGYSMGYDSMPCSIAVDYFNNDSRIDIVTVNYGTSELAILLATENGTFLINKYSTGKSSYPRSVITGDFNNDHYIDIAVANSGTYSIGVFLGNGNGTFRTITTYPTGFNSRLEFIVAGDFDNDNNPDLIVANSGEDNIMLFKGNGKGNFIIVTNQSTGIDSDPCSMAINDFDNDDKVDIVVVNSGTNYILVFTLYDFHTTAIQQPYSTGSGSYPYSVAVGDFNNDTLSDIVVANTYTSNIGVFIGSDNGTFTNQEILPTIVDDLVPFSIAVDDLNNDKQLDIAVAMIWAGVIYIYLGQGNGSFNYGGIYPVGDDYLPPFSIAIADFNNGTNRDIVTVSCEDDTVAILLGYGDGTFGNATIYRTEPYSCPIFISVGDFNSDDLLDLISANYDSPTISMFLGNGNGTFQDVLNISTNDHYSSWLIVGDLNNDKQQDIVFISPEDSIIGILLGNGDGTFGNISTYSTGFENYPWSAVLGDFNNDTRVDIAVVNALDSSIAIFFGHGNGTFVSQDPIFIQDAFYPTCIVTGDFNNDSQVDIVVGNTGSDGISVLLLRYQAEFTHATYYYQGSGSHPFSVMTGDFNNDNQTDIVVANSGNDTVQVLIGYDNGTFKSNITYSTGIDSHPQYVVTADFNKDNQVDIAVVNSFYDSLMIFLNSDNGTFNTSTQYSTGSKSSPNSIGLGDFNEDGWMDIVVANNYINNVGVFLGFDYPTFTSRNTVVLKRGSLPYYVVVDDFNRDSQWDIAIAYKRKDSIGVFLGNGNGTFVNESTYFLGDSYDPISLTTGYFNNDTQLDIAVANSGNNSISILLGKSDGTFTEHKSYSTGSSSPVSIAIGDFDNDTIQDLVVANRDGNNVGVLIGSANGSFTKQISYPMPNESAPVWVAVDDFNRDNILDIAVANNKANNIGILLGYRNGTFRNVTIYSTGNNSGPSSIAIGDFNKDNCIDIAVANRVGKNVGIFFGHGDGTFSLRATYSTGFKSSLTSIAINDLNNDTILDIAVSDWGTGYGNIGVLYGLNNGTFLVPKTYSTGFNSDPTSIAICDFNNDGRIGFVVSNSKKNNIGIMLRNKSEPFGIQTTFSTGNGSGPHSVAVTDFNNDDHLDIAVANFNTDNIGIFLGYGNGSFAKQETYSTGQDSCPMSIAIGDFNNDEQSDIVVANYNAGTISILHGYGNGTFTIVQTYSTGESSEPTSVAIADLNKDNQIDIVVTNSGINIVLVFLGIGDGTFSNPKSFSFDYDSTPISAAIGDFNNDTWLDIAVANNGLGYVEILLNSC